MCLSQINMARNGFFFSVFIRVKYILFPRFCKSIWVVTSCPGWKIKLEILEMYSLSVSFLFREYSKQHIMIFQLIISYLFLWMTFSLSFFKKKNNNKSKWYEKFAHSFISCYLHFHSLKTTEIESYIFGYKNITRNIK